MPEGVSEDELTGMLFQPYYWDEAIRQFGNNPARDRLVLRALIDQSNARYDLNLAGHLALKFYAEEEIGFEPPRRSLPILVDVAEALVDVQQGVPDYGAAAKLLDWFSPNAPHRLTPEAERKAAHIWVRIAQHRLGDSDPSVRKLSEVILATGDPLALLDVRPEDVLPPGSEVVTLNRWPPALPPLKELTKAAERIGGDYPSRALRANQSGRVELGLLFGQDGRFQQFHITKQPRAPALASAAQRAFKRYLLPETDILHLPGYSGKYVFVTLPSVTYRLQEDEGQSASEAHSIDRDGFEVTATGRMHCVY